MATEDGEAEAGAARLRPSYAYLVLSRCSDAIHPNQVDDRSMQGTSRGSTHEKVQTLAQQSRRARLGVAGIHVRNHLTRHGQKNVLALQAQCQNPAARLVVRQPREAREPASFARGTMFTTTVLSPAK